MYTFRAPKRKKHSTDMNPFAESWLEALRGSLTPPLPTFATTVLQLRVLQGLLMLKAISPHLDKVNVCFDIANGGVVMGCLDFSVGVDCVSQWCEDVMCVCEGGASREKAGEDKIEK